MRDALTAAETAPSLIEAPAASARLHDRRPHLPDAVAQIIDRLNPQPEAAVQGHRGQLQLEARALVESWRQGVLVF